jgi:hypothetical protein
LEENLSILANPEKDIEYFVNQAMQTWNVPGLTLVIIKDDQVVLSRGMPLARSANPTK